MAREEPQLPGATAFDRPRVSQMIRCWQRRRLDSSNDKMQGVYEVAQRIGNHPSLKLPL
jgi:hypothetical protein